MPVIFSDNRDDYSDNLIQHYIAMQLSMNNEVQLH